MEERETAKVYMLLGGDGKGAAEEVILKHGDQFSGKKPYPTVHMNPEPNEKTMTAVESAVTQAWDYLLTEKKVSDTDHHTLSFRVGHQDAGIEGPSLGLAVYLKVVCEFIEHEVHVAATGKLNQRGEVEKVGEIKGKIEAALEKLPENGYLVVPRDNYEEERDYFDALENEHRGINILSVGTAGQAIENILQPELTASPAHDEKEDEQPEIPAPKTNKLLFVIIGIIIAAVIIIYFGFVSRDDKSVPQQQQFQKQYQRQGLNEFIKPLASVMSL